MRHPFKPTRHDPSRCASCLRKLDCAPHLPLWPPTADDVWSLIHRNYITNGNLFPGGGLPSARRPAGAVSRAAR